MHRNQAPMNLTTDVVFGSRSLRLRCADLANAMAAVGRMTIQRPSDPNSRKKRPTSLLFVMIVGHHCLNMLEPQRVQIRSRRWSFVVGRSLMTSDQRPRDCFQARQLAVRQATLDSQPSLSNKAHSRREGRVFEHRCQENAAPKMRFFLQDYCRRDFRLHTILFWSILMRNELY